MTTMDVQGHRLVVPRSARYWTLGELDGAVSEVWVVCHGYQQLAAEFLDSAKALAQPHRLLVAPEALSRFYHDNHQQVGASWMTREDREREMEDYVRYWDLLCDQVFEIVERSSVRLVLLGYSQGAATATRWAVRGRCTVDHLVLWGAATPPELDSAAALEPLNHLKLTLVSGTRDKLFPEAARQEQRERLTQHGVIFSEMSFDGGHRLDDDTLVELAARA